MLTHLKARSPNPMLDMQSSNPGAAKAVICLAEVQKNYAARLTCLLQVLHLLQIAQHLIANPAVWVGSSLLEGRPKAASQSLGQQLVVAAEEGNGALAVQQGPQSAYQHISVTQLAEQARATQGHSS